MQHPSRETLTASILADYIRIQGPVQIRYRYKAGKRSATVDYMSQLCSHGLITSLMVGYSGSNTDKGEFYITYLCSSKNLERT